ncbi:M48 family metalloprotease [Actinosynnema sp. NPDC020468]|uniref:M48 family metalloprotease n=1 Tax=Actinosynnema sp. NPDC020468 TaxID=3154488 RepID=UPI0033D70577
MHVSVYLALLLPLLVVPVVRRAADHCHPRTATRLLTATALVTALAGVLSAVLLVIAAAVGRPEVGRPVGVVAAVLLAAALVATTRAAVGHARTLRAARSEARRHGSDLVVLPDETPLAYALPGAPGRVVVSTGLLAVLDPTERRVLLAHERAHLTHRHHRHLLVTTLAAAAQPTLRPLRAAVAYSVERWADEVAAERVGDRHAVARAVGKAALATRRSTTAPAGALHAAAGPVPRRVAALLAPTGRRRVAALVTVVAVALSTLTPLSSIDAADDLRELLQVGYTSTR